MVFKKNTKKPVAPAPDVADSSAAAQPASVAEPAPAPLPAPEKTAGVALPARAETAPAGSTQASSDGPVFQRVTLGGSNRTQTAADAVKKGSTEAAQTESPAPAPEKKAVTATAGVTSGGGWWTKKAEVRSADKDFKALHKSAKHFTTASEQQVR